MTPVAYGRATHFEIPPCRAQALERRWSVDQLPSLHLAVAPDGAALPTRAFFAPPARFRPAPAATAPAGRGCDARDVGLRAGDLGRGADRS